MNDALIPHLKGLCERLQATPQQKIIREIMSGADKVRIDTEKNLLDMPDKVDEITAKNIDHTHALPLS